MLDQNLRCATFRGTVPGVMVRGFRAQIQHVAKKRKNSMPSNAAVTIPVVNSGEAIEAGSQLSL